MRPLAKRSIPRPQVKLTSKNSTNSLMLSSVTSVSANSLEKVIEKKEESTEKKEEKKVSPVTSMILRLSQFSQKLTPITMELLDGMKSKLLL